MIMGTKPNLKSITGTWDGKDNLYVLGVGGGVGGGATTPWRHGKQRNFQQSYVPIRASFEEEQPVPVPVL